MTNWEFAVLLEFSLGFAAWELRECSQLAFLSQDSVVCQRFLFEHGDFYLFATVILMYRQVNYKTEFKLARKMANV